MRTYEILVRSKVGSCRSVRDLRVRAGTKRPGPGLCHRPGVAGLWSCRRAGQWADLYPGEGPASYGLDSDKSIPASDGARLGRRMRITWQ